MRSILLLQLLLFSFGLMAETGKDDHSEPIKPYLTSFTNMGYHFQQPDFSLEQDKILFGVKWELRPALLLTVGFDLFETDHQDSRYKRPYLKPFSLQYTYRDWTAEAGIINTSQYDYQRNQLWGFRYVFRTMQNHYSMGHNADLGFRLSKKVNDWLSGDLSLTSGESHKSPGLESHNKYALRLFIKPLNRLTFSAYGDRMSRGLTEHTFAGTVDYRNKDRYSLSMELNLKDNFRFSEGHRLSGISVYGNYKLNQQFRLFGRWDCLKGEGEDAGATVWNQENLGQRVIGGVQYIACKFCRIALNYHHWKPNSAVASPDQYLSLDMEIKY